MMCIDMLKRFLVVIALAVALLLSSCIDRLYGFETELPTGELLTPDMIESLIDAAMVTEVEKCPIETDESGNLIVFWLPGGSVWHVSTSCSSVARSDPEKVKSGSIPIAISEGKDRACQKCAKDIEYDVIYLETDTQLNIHTTNSSNNDVSQSFTETFNSEYRLVFWTKGGSVWHSTASCSSLANTDPADIISGNEDEAIAAGKERICKKCS